jgi:DNA transformation protein and related proteins
MSEFVSSLHEVFERFGRIDARRMFGGHTLYLKTDAENVAHFDRLKLPHFEYQRGGKTMQTSYREAPAEVFEDREEAAVWARRALEAALRSGHAPKKKPQAKQAAAKTARKRPAR